MKKPEPAVNVIEGLEHYQGSYYNERKQKWPDGMWGTLSQEQKDNLKNCIFVDALIYLLENTPGLPDMYEDIYRNATNITQTDWDKMSVNDRWAAFHSQYKPKTER